MNRRLWSLLVVTGSGVTAAIAACGNAQSVADASMIDGPPAADLARGCTFQAKLDETSWPATGKPVLDTCGSDNGALSGSSAKPVNDGVRGQVGSFAGSACINVASSDALHATTALSMSAWIKPTALPGGNGESLGIISKRVDRGDAEEYGLFVWTGNHIWIDLGATDRFNGSAVLATATWTHVAAVYDATQPDADRVKLYINGVRDPLDHVPTGDLGTLPTTDSPLHLGCIPAPTSASPPTMQTFQGELDNVTIWNRALTSDEISLLAKS